MWSTSADLATWMRLTRDGRLLQLFPPRCLEPPAPPRPDHRRSHCPPPAPPHNLLPRSRPTRHTWPGPPKTGGDRDRGRKGRKIAEQGRTRSCRPVSTGHGHRIGVPARCPFGRRRRGDVLWSAVDAKPKSTRRLARLTNITGNPAVSVLVDHYQEDWSALWWVRADGTAEVMDAVSGEDALDGRRACCQVPAVRHRSFTGTVYPCPVAAMELVGRRMSRSLVSSPGCRTDVNIGRHATRRDCSWLLPDQTPREGLCRRRGVRPGARRAGHWAGYGGRHLRPPEQLVGGLRAEGLQPPRPPRRPAPHRRLARVGGVVWNGCRVRASPAVLDAGDEPDNTANKRRTPNPLSQHAGIWRAPRGPFPSRSRQLGPGW